MTCEEPVPAAGRRPATGMARKSSAEAELRKEFYEKTTNSARSTGARTGRVFLFFTAFFPEIARGSAPRSTAARRRRGDHGNGEDPPAATAPPFLDVPGALRRRRSVYDDIVR